MDTCFRSTFKPHPKLRDPRRSLATGHDFLRNLAFYKGFIRDGYVGQSTSWLFDSLGTRNSVLESCLYFGIATPVADIISIKEYINKAFKGNTLYQPMKCKIFRALINEPTYLIEFRPVTTN